MGEGRGGGRSGEGRWGEVTVPQKRDSPLGLLLPPLGSQ